jgi:hypothetical protein
VTPQQQVAKECCNLQCYDCDKGVPLVEFHRDNNLYHTNGGPCRSYLIRRRFNLMDDVSPVAIPQGWRHE